MEPEMIYVLEERIGDPALFCGRTREMTLLMNWIGLIPKKLAKSRALLGRRKSGKTAIMQRLFNILWNRHGPVIPFYFEVLDRPQWLLEFSDLYFRAFLSQYVSFKTRISLEKENKPWEWPVLNEMLRDLNNDTILREIGFFQDHLAQEHEHATIRLAFGAPAAFTGYDDVFFVVMIDEIQYMTEYIFYDRACTLQTKRLPGAFHGLVELKYAPMMVSGSYVGWMRQMMQEIFVGGRLRGTPFSPRLTFAEGMEAVYRYAEHFEIPLTEQLAFSITLLTQSDPFYIATLLGSEWEERDFSTRDGVIETFAHEILDRDGELFKTWGEYINNTIKAINDVHGKKILLFLSREREQEKTREEIREHIGWPPEKDRELEEKLRTFQYGDLMTQGHTNFHYQGIADDVLDAIFRSLYQFEIERVEPDLPAELAARIHQLEDDKKSLQGALNELKGRMLELIVWRELNACRKTGKPVANFTNRLRPVVAVERPETLQNVVELCRGATFTTVWQNFYLQAPEQPASLQVDVLADGEDEQGCWALVFEMKNRDAKHPPTLDEAQLFATKAAIVRRLLEQRGKPLRFVCPVYFSAKGFAPDVETFLHQQGILTTDLETWELELNTEEKDFLKGDFT